MKPLARETSSTVDSYLRKRGGILRHFLLWDAAALRKYCCGGQGMGAMVMVRILLSSNDRVCAQKSIDVRGSEEEFRQDEEFVTCKCYGTYLVSP